MDTLAFGFESPVNDLEAGQGYGLGVCLSRFRLRVDSLSFLFPFRGGQVSQPKPKRYDHAARRHHLVQNLKDRYLVKAGPVRILLGGLGLG